MQNIAVGSRPLGEQTISYVNQSQQTVHDVSCGIKFMVGYLYFLQGFISAIAINVPYIYPNLPDYFILSLFSLSVLPFSLKFISAPLLQKYHHFEYGKRKTWLIIAEIFISCMLLLCSFFTHQENSKVLAILLIFVYFGVSIHDISLDSLALKQFKSAKLMSTIQAACQSSGNIIGGLFWLKATSHQFAARIGRTSDIANLQQLIIGFTIILVITTCFIHFLFKQTKLYSQRRIKQKSIMEIYSIYKYFFKIQYRYCRLLIYFLFYIQGFNFFNAGYNYQLIKNGFSRDTMNTIDNVQNFITTAIVFMVGTNASILGFTRTIMIYMSLMLIVDLYLWIWFPEKVIPVIITNFLLGLLGQWNYLVTVQLAAYFPEVGSTGMLYTMGASVSNFGKNLFIHTSLLKVWPWKTLSMIGLVIQVPIIFAFTPKMMKLVQEGETNIQYEEDQGGDQLNEQLQF